MIEKNARRLSELARELTYDNKVLEFLELYGILKTEARHFNELEGVISLKEFFEGVISAKDEAEVGGKDV